MAGVTPRLTPAALAEALGALSVRIDSAHVELQSVALPDYPGEPRPSSTLRLTGAGCSGLGENVAFTRAEQERFAAHVQTWFRALEGRAPLRVNAARDASGTPYERAAIEAALIDLGLRQAGLSLADLSGVRAAALGFVVSLSAEPEPLLAVQRLREAAYTGDLKIDVDPAWDPRMRAAIAREPSIAIFDFKGRADAAFARELARLNERALFEDPPSGFDDPSTSASLYATRIARDASLSDARAVAAASARGEFVNLKAPRMGGPLELLRGLEHARSRAYLGGMFEVGVGRSQARQLAALYCPDRPNDLALNIPDPHTPGARENPPALVSLSTLGFGTAARDQS